MAMPDGTSISDYLPYFFMFGVERYVKVPQFKGFPTSEFTVSAWVQFNGGNNNVPFLVYTSAGGGILFAIEDVSNVRFVFNNRDIVASGKSIADKKAHHIAVSWKENDPTHATVKIYIDGNKVKEQIIDKDALEQMLDGGQLWLGVETEDNENLDANSIFPGDIFSLRFHDFEMLPEQILRDMKTPDKELMTSVASKGVILALPLNSDYIDFEKNLALDISSRGLNGDYLNIGSGNPIFGSLLNCRNFPTDELTISTWIRCGQDSKDTTLINYSPDTNESATAPNLLISGFAPVSIFFNGNSYSSEVSLIDGKWHHLAITLSQKEPSYLKVQIFVDFELREQGQINKDADVRWISDQPLYLGATLNDNESSKFRGMMRDFRIWNCVCSDRDLKSEAFSVLNPRNLIVHWTMAKEDVEDVTPQKFSDRSGNGNDCELTGVRWFPVSWVDYSKRDLSPDAGWKLTQGFLRGGKFIGANLNGQSLAQADLTGADFSGAQFQGTDLSQAILYGTNFSKTDLTKAKFDAIPNFSRNKIFRTSFRQAHLLQAAIGMDWRYLDLTEADVQLIATLNGLVADYAILSRTTFLHSQSLQHASFQGADLSDAKLSEADLTGAKLDGANLSRANMTRVNFYQAKLTRALMKGAICQYCNFASADLTNVFGDSLKNESAAIFSYSFMYNAILKDCQFQFADFTQVHLYGIEATVANSNLSSCSFSNAILSELDFSSTILEGTEFNSAQLINCKFAGATLKNSRFEGAYLQGVKFEGVSDVQSCNFTGSLFGTNGTEAGKFTICEQDGTTYTVQWDAFDPATSKLDSSCVCPDGKPGPCNTNERFKPAADKAPYPPVPDQIPNSEHPVEPPSDWNIPRIGK